MANNRMYFVCNVCLPEGENPKDYDHWRAVSFHIAKWYPGGVGEWYTNRAETIGKALDEFFETHAHSNKYRGGVENPVRLDYEWIGTPIVHKNAPVQPTKPQSEEEKTNAS